MEEFDFSGFMPALKNIEITPSTSMITTEGGIMTGHIIKVTLGNDEEVVFSVGEDQLQKIFFLILKIING
jgi:hypothetical protein